MKLRITLNHLPSILLLVMLGCGPRSATLQLPIGVELDPDFSSAEQELLKSDLEWLEEFEMPLPERRANRSAFKLSKWFEEVFGGSASSDVLSFIDERTAYYVATTRVLAEQVALARYGSTNPMDKTTVGKNIGTGLFLGAMAERQKVYYNFDGTMIPVNDTRVGLIQLTNEFFQIGRRTDAGIMMRLSTLVHEARHSDCTGGLRRSTLESIKAQAPLTENACGHSHVQCPYGHDYAGLDACDDAKWGAYATEAVFAARISECEDCSEALFQTALLFALERRARVLTRVSLFSGDLGPPDMSHTTHVIEDVK